MLSAPGSCEKRRDDQPETSRGPNGPDQRINEKGEMLASQRHASHFGIGRRGVLLLLGLGLLSLVLWPSFVAGREVVDVDADPGAEEYGIFCESTLRVSARFGFDRVAAVCGATNSSLLGLSGRASRTAYGSSGTPTGETRISLLTRLLYLRA